MTLTEFNKQSLACGKRHWIRMFTYLTLRSTSRVFITIILKVYEHLVTTAARDQQLVPTTRSKDFFFLNIAGNSTDFCLLTFFSNLQNLFYNSSRKPPRDSMTSRFLICIFYFITLQENPHRRTRI